MQIKNKAVRAFIGLIIATERRKKGFSQAELCWRTGITSTYMSLIETGDRVPSYEVLEKMAICLGTTAGELMNRAEGKNAGIKVNARTSMERILENNQEDEIRKLVYFLELLS